MHEIEFHTGPKENFSARDVIWKNFHVLESNPKISSIFSDNLLASLFSTEQKYPRDPKFVGFPTRGCASSLLCLLLWHHNKQGGIHLVCLQNFQTIYHPPPPFCMQLYDAYACVQEYSISDPPSPHYTGTSCSIFLTSILVNVDLP